MYGWAGLSMRKLLASVSFSVVPLMAGLALLAAPMSKAQPSVGVADQRAETDKHYIAKVELHTKAELGAFLMRAAQLIDKAVADPVFSPIEVILHGKEIELLLRENYLKNKQLVNQAAMLDALNVINIQVCETWMRLNQRALNQLPAFVETVPYGPAEEKKLLNQGAVYF